MLGCRAGNLKSIQSPTLPSLCKYVNTVGGQMVTHTVNIFSRIAIEGLLNCFILEWNNKCKHKTHTKPNQRRLALCFEAAPQHL